MNVDYFSESYGQARDRFRESAQRIGAVLSSHAINADSNQTIDVATIGARTENVIVLSSGVHGVEGFLGSAIQLAWMDQIEPERESGRPSLVLIHAINPYGFANLRRWNEDNVDLNRNFHDLQSGYTGSPSRYAQFSHLLNPERPARQLDTFKLSAICNLIRYGLPALKEVIASGQYDYPNGLFFGGNEASESTRIVQTNISDWIGDAQNVIHIDVHSGLGRFADCRLLLVQPSDDPDCQWYRATFDFKRVEPLAGADGFAYVPSGDMGTWLRRQFPERRYRSVTAEFGTYSPLRVLAALRRENQVHRHNKPTDRVYELAKRELLECFCPRSTRWRQHVVATGLEILSQSEHALMTSAAGVSTTK